MIGLVAWGSAAAVAGPWSLTHFEGRTADGGAFTPVEERLGSPTFGMIVLPPDPPRALAMLDEWSRDRAIQLRFPLLALYDDEALPSSLAGSTLVFHAVRPGDFAWVEQRPAMLTCSASACVPTEVSTRLPVRLGGAARRAVAAATGRSVAKGRDPVVRSFEQARRATESAEVAAALVAALPSKARTALERLPAEARAEALAVVLYESRTPSLKSGLQLALDDAPQFDLACTTLDLDACEALARDKEAFYLRRRDLDAQLGREPLDRPMMPSETEGDSNHLSRSAFERQLRNLERIEKAYARSCEAGRDAACVDRDRLSGWTRQLAAELDADAAELDAKRAAARAARAEALETMVVGELPEGLPEVPFSEMRPRGELESPALPGTARSGEPVACLAEIAVVPEGTVSAVRVRGCEDAFAEAVRHVARGWRFARTGRDGPVKTQLTVGFRP